jgi:hypothetical protein
LEAEGIGDGGPFPARVIKLWESARDAVLNDPQLREELQAAEVDPRQVEQELEKARDIALSGVLSLRAQERKQLADYDLARAARQRAALILAGLVLTFGLLVGIFVGVGVQRSVGIIWILGQVGLFLILLSAVLVVFWNARVNLRRAERRYIRIQSTIVERLREGTLSYARAAANRLAKVPFDEIRIRRAAGLSEMIAPALEVSTRSKQALAAALSGMEAASIGISGSRGAGKSTLIAAACEGRLMDDDVEPRGVRVAAPMRYDSVEFIPYLFNQLCLAILPPKLDEQRRTSWRARVNAFLAAALVLAGISIGTLLANEAFVPSFGWPVAVGVGLASAVAIVTGLAMLKPSGVSQLTAEEARAQRALNALRYRETLVRGSSGEVGPDWLRLVGKREVTSAEQPPTLPDLIVRYRGFVREIAKTRKVIIGIDELDKMQPADARELLNDVKVLFGEANCFYLVSMSEDAMSSFERRGMPIRDVFDSSFDAVLHVDRLDAKESSTLLRQRVVGMGDAGYMLCHLLAGGLPRELIRTARSIRDATGESPTLPILIAAEACVTRRMELLERATEMVARRTVSEDGSQPLLQWLRTLPSLRTHEDLGARWDVADVLSALSASNFDAEHAREPVLATLQLAAAAYHAHSVWTFFLGLSEQRFAEAMSRHGAESPALETLASAQADLMVSPRIAWGSIDRFRTRVSMPLIAFPAD